MISVVCVSDTHGRHAELTDKVRDSDILIHAGDFTRFANKKHATAFNEWLGHLPHRHKLVVLGNHEQNADWVGDARAILFNGTVLLDDSVSLDFGDRGVVCVHGTRFAWPESPDEAEAATGSSPRSRSGSRYNFPDGVDVVVAHGPAKGYVDGGAGCPSLLAAVKRAGPTLVVSGHIHAAHGMDEGTGGAAGTTFINAANVKKGYSIGWEPICMHIVPKAARP